jgi:hypothetical protein
MLALLFLYCHFAPPRARSHKLSAPQNVCRVQRVIFPSFFAVSPWPCRVLTCLDTRDIKPENLLLTKSGGVKLGDFGTGQIVRDNDMINKSAGIPHVAAVHVNAHVRVCARSKVLFVDEYKICCIQLAAFVYISVRLRCACLHKTMRSRTCICVHSRHHLEMFVYMTECEHFAASAMTTLT